MKSGITPSTRSRALLTALLLTVLSSVLMLPGRSVMAAVNCTYYSDATYTIVVGKYGTDCCGNTLAWGIRTRYYQCSAACFACAGGNDCTAMSNQYIASMVRPSSSDPLAVDKCLILYNNCNELCVNCKSNVDQTACLANCKGAYAPPNCP